jgi:hypothetical protein
MIEVMNLQALIWGPALFLSGQIMMTKEHRIYITSSN